MKFTLSWLKDHLETEASLDEILDALTDLGLEVEGVENPADALGVFSICRVLDAKQHPNADRLRVCQVEYWPDGPEAKSASVQVVCGAPNARTGLVGVFAPPGAYVPGTDLLLKPTKIRDVESNGMLCSERELMISEDHDGIIDLPEDAPLGMRFVDYAGLDDPVIEIAITPNRPDALGVRGVARDLAARGIGTLKPGKVKPVKGAFKSPISVSLAPEVTERGDRGEAACPLFVGRMIRNVKNGPSPEWLQKRLRAIGLRPISALVDITNLVTYDRARPLHVFDADRLSGDIVVRLSKAGETMKGLDDRDHTLEDGMTVVCDRDGARPSAIGGILGGEETGCTFDTVTVFLESAYFDPIRTAITGRKLDIQSDARYRNERGIDPLFTEPGAELATQLILDLCGGEASDLVIAGAPPSEGKNMHGRKVHFDPERVSKLVGMDIPKAEQIRILTALGFKVGKGAAPLVDVPSWRPDVSGAADLVEEVARVASLTKLESAPMRRIAPGVAKPVMTRPQILAMTARRTLAALGLHECVTYSFIDGASAALFGGGDTPRRLENPIASDKSDMRPSLLPALLSAAARNQARGAADVALFELGPEFTGGEPGEQRDVATALRVGASTPRHWSNTRRPVDLYDAKADAEALLAALGAPVDRLMIDRETNPWLHPGRSARLKLGPKVVLAEFGELHPKTLAALDVKGPAVATTVYLEQLPKPRSANRTRPALTLHDLQAVERDFAFVVDARVEAADILRAARGAEKKLIVDATVFDVFSGPKAEQSLGEGKKSVAISVTLQPTEKTLTDKEIESVSDKVVAAAAKAVGATLRG